MKRSWIKRGKSVLKRKTPLLRSKVFWQKENKLSRYRKYGNKSCQCIMKHWHDSVLEATHCNKLYAMATRKEIKGYKIQKTFALDVKGEHICDMRVDFWVIGNDGKEYVVESKGFKTEIWRLKWKLFCAIHPKIDYVIWEN